MNRFAPRTWSLAIALIVFLGLAACRKEQGPAEVTAVSHPTILAIAMHYVDENGQFINNAWFTLEPQDE